MCVCACVCLSLCHSVSVCASVPVLQSGGVADVRLLDRGVRAGCPFAVFRFTLKEGNVLTARLSDVLQVRTSQTESAVCVCVCVCVPVCLSDCTMHFARVLCRCSCCCGFVRCSVCSAVMFACEAIFESYRGCACICVPLTISVRAQVQDAGGVALPSDTFSSVEALLSAASPAYRSWVVSTLSAKLAASAAPSDA